MTAQGEDILAWLDAAITKAEAGADRWHDAECSFHETTIIDVTVLQGGATLCDCQGPASVRRRCAADRKILAAYASLLGAADQPEDDRDPLRMPSEEAMKWLDRGSARSSAHEALELLRPVMEALAEGYGWPEGAESKTQPTEGDDVT